MSNLLGRGNVRNPARRIIDRAVERAEMRAGMAMQGASFTSGEYRTRAATDGEGDAYTQWPFRLNTDDLGGDDAYLSVKGIAYDYGD